MERNDIPLLILNLKNIYNFYIHPNHRKYKYNLICQVGCKYKCQCKKITEGEFRLMEAAFDIFIILKYYQDENYNNNELNQIFSNKFDHLEYYLLTKQFRKI
jgi:hypothetical protein